MASVSDYQKENEHMMQTARLDYLPYKLIGKERWNEYIISTLSLRYGNRCIYGIRLGG